LLINKILSYRLGMDVSLICNAKIRPIGDNRVLRKRFQTQSGGAEVARAQIELNIRVNGSHLSHRFQVVRQPEKFAKFERIVSSLHRWRQQLRSSSYLAGDMRDIFIVIISRMELPLIWAVYSLAGHQKAKSYSWRLHLIVNSFSW